jgi:peroxiredoxin
MLTVGDTAPSFTLTAQDKSIFSSEEHSGTRMLVVFYPAAFTGVCTEEMCSFSDLMGDLEKAGCTVVGISVDAPFSNAAFAESNEIGFPLLSDVHRSVINDFGVAYKDF